MAKKSATSKKPAASKTFASIAGKKSKMVKEASKAKDDRTPDEIPDGPYVADVTFRVGVAKTGDPWFAYDCEIARGPEAGKKASRLIMLCDQYGFEGGKRTDEVVKTEQEQWEAMFVVLKRAGLQDVEGMGPEDIESLCKDTQEDPVLCQIQVKNWISDDKQRHKVNVYINGPASEEG